MSIEVACEHCQKNYLVGDDKAGRRFRCQDCGTQVQVPGSEFDDVFGEVADAEFGGKFSGASDPIRETASQGENTRHSTGSNVKVVVIAVVGIALVAGMVFGAFVVLKPDNELGDELVVDKSQDPALDRRQDLIPIPPEFDPLLNDPDGFDPNNLPQGGFDPNNALGGGFDPDVGNPMELRGNPVVLEMPEDLPEIPSVELEPFTEFETRFIQSDAVFAWQINPAAIFTSPYGKQIPPAFLALFQNRMVEIPLVEQYIMSFTLPEEYLPRQVDGDSDKARADQFLAQFTNTETVPNLMDHGVISLRFTKDYPRPLELIQKYALGNQTVTPPNIKMTVKLEVITIEGKTCFRATRKLYDLSDDPDTPKMVHSQVIYMPNLRTAVITSPEMLERLFKEEQSSGPLAKKLKQIPIDSHGSVTLSLEKNAKIRSLLTLLAKQKLEGGLAVLSSLPEDLETFTLIMSLSGDTILHGAFTGIDKQGADRIEPLMQQLKGLISAGYALWKFQMSPDLKNDPTWQKVLASLDQVVAGVEVGRENETSTLTAPQPKGLSELIPQLLPSLPEP